MNDETRAARWQRLAQLQERLGSSAPASPPANGIAGLLAEFVARAADRLVGLDEAARDAFLLQLVNAVDSAVEQRAELIAMATAPPARRLTEEELEWARGLYSEEEVLAGLRDLEETGGQELDAFLPALEAAAGRDE